MRRRDLMGGMAASFVGLPARAVAPRPVVVELFTSQGCSSCPPAEALLSELARGRADVLALSFHVTYWNDLGWRDPFSFEAATQRQRRYAGLLQSDIYTPQMVVDGGREMVGSDRARVLAAIAEAAARRFGPELAVTRRDGQAEIAIGAGQGAGDILLLGYDAGHRTSVGRGENAGRTLTESNVVRSLAHIGSWSGAEWRGTQPLPAGERVAVLVQAPGGRMLAASAADPA